MKHTQKAHDQELSEIQKLALSCDDKSLALNCSNGTIELWSTVTNDIQQRIINSHSNRFKIMVFSPDNTSIISSEVRDAKIKFWDPVKGSLQYTIEDRHCISLAFSSDGKVLATCTFPRSVNLWDFTSGLILQTFAVYAADCLAFSSNG